VTAAAALDPACAGDDAFVDALVGVDRVCRWLGAEVDRAEVDRAAATAGGDRDAGGDGDGDVDPDAAAELDEPLAAVLGLVSLRTTLSLVIAALCGDPGDAEPEVEAAWSRELLR